MQHKRKVKEPVINTIQKQPTRATTTIGNNVSGQSNGNNSIKMPKGPEWHAKCSGERN